MAKKRKILICICKCQHQPMCKRCDIGYCKLKKITVYGPERYPFRKNPKLRKNVWTFAAPNQFQILNPKGVALKGTKMKGRIDYTAARELFLFIQNDSQLYRQEQAIDANLRRKLKRGIFNKALAVKLFMYLADAGAKKYSTEFGGSFEKKTRFAVAAMLTRYWIDARRNEGMKINPLGKPIKPYSKKQVRTLAKHFYKLLVAGRITPKDYSQRIDHLRHYGR